MPSPMEIIIGQDSSSIKLKSNEHFYLLLSIITVKSAGFIAQCQNIFQGFSMTFNVFQGPFSIKTTCFQGCFHQGPPFFFNFVQGCRVPKMIKFPDVFDVSEDKKLCSVIKCTEDARKKSLKSCKQA